MTEWTVIELQNWKHGWIPLTPEAAAIKAKKKSGSLKGKPGKLTVADALANNKLPPALRNKNLYGGEAEHHKAISEYLDKYPGGWEGAKQAVAKEAETKKAVNAKRDKLNKVRIERKPQPGPTGDKVRVEPTAAQQHSMGRINVTRSGKRSNITAAKVKEMNRQEADLVREYQSLTGNPDLTKDERAALNDWQFGFSEATEGQLYTILNTARRTGNWDAVDPDDMVDLERIESGLESAITRSRLQRDALLFRGIRGVNPNIKVGDTITDPGWAATSYSPYTAEGFRQGQPNSKVMVIHAKKGTPALVLDDPVEREVILGPNTPLRVIEINDHEIHLEMP